MSEIIKKLWMGDIDAVLAGQLLLPDELELLEQTEEEPAVPPEQNQEGEAENEPQAEVKNQEDDTDKPIIPTDDGQTELSHGGNESTAQTDTTTNMEEGGDNGTQQQQEPSDNQDNSSNQNQGSSGGQSEQTDDTGSDSDSDSESEGGHGSRADEPAEDTEDTDFDTAEDAEDNWEYEDWYEEDYEPQEADETDETADGAGDPNYRSYVSHQEKTRVSEVAKHFRTLLENLGCERSFEVPGAQYLSIREVVRRVVDKRPLWQCYVDEIKTNVIVLIDNSGSMMHSLLLMDVAYEIAQRMQNVKAYYMPNGGWDWAMPEEKVKKAEKDLNAAQVVLYIGDFDGADTPIELALKGKEVIWICPEMGRYRSIEEHDWVHHTEEEMERLQRMGRLFVYWVDGIEDVNKEYIRAFKDALVRRRTQRRLDLLEDF